MRKHKNIKQQNIFLKFMKNHPDVARGFVKGDKVAQDEQWNKLKDELNAAGPPTKETSCWKKVWLDWKRNVKGKLAHNKMEVQKTGGGNFNQCVLNNMDDEVALVCGLYKTVEGIENTKSFGVIKKKISPQSCASVSSPSPASYVSPASPASCASSPSSPSYASSSASGSPQPTTSNQSKRQRNNANENESPAKKKRDVNLEELLGEENNNLKSISAHIEMLDKSKNVERAIFENIDKKLDNIDNRLNNIDTNLKNINNNLENLGRKYDKIIELKEKKLEEISRHNILNEKHDIRMEKNEVSKLNVKIQAINLEQLKFDAQTGNNTNRN